MPMATPQTVMRRFEAGLLQVGRFLLRSQPRLHLFTMRLGRPVGVVAVEREASDGFAAGANRGRRARRLPFAADATSLFEVAIIGPRLKRASM